ncbi:histidinol-phosphate transaminase [Bowdeniella nasicola]|uniref:Histidinol-phosphate aminotransferase n=1 Tax=Bowdeniella nasicola TaxID=208480 RepID=A0A1Q5PZY2_9ACTO|nr:histidinol-phosphate transaminase [Bowdeniella nasicola]OKL53198.1 histidinol-phosphate transaminase [Bowdeniella nasicola]
MSTSLPLRKDLSGCQPYGAPELEVTARLNVNENPYPPSDAVTESIAEAVRAAAAGANRYPEREFPALRAALADYLAVESGVRLDPEQIWAANGSNEVMLHLMQAFGGPRRAVVTANPTYSMYPEYARDTFTDYVTVDRNPDFTLDINALLSAASESAASLVLVASPNNPTGTAASLQDIRALCAGLRGKGPNGSDGLVVVDEAYGEFRRGGVASALTLLETHDNLVVTRTMSKAFGMAGLRLGYLAASRAIIDALRIVRLPYHLSAITQAAALAALSHRDELMAQIAHLRELRDDLATWLTEQGYTVIDSDANFLLFGPHPDRHAVWAGLLGRGVLIREVGPEDYLRVSIGTDTEMDLFKTSLLEVTRGTH